MTASKLDFIHRFEPSPLGERGPVLLLLHGTGGDEDDLMPLAPMLAPDAAVLSPRGKVLEHGMPRFFRRLAEGVFDLEDLQLRTHELADFIAAAAVEYGFDVDRVIAAGFSNGANIAAAMLLLRPDALQGAVLLHAMMPLDPETPPDLRGKRVFMGAGRFDPIIAPNNTLRLEALLRESGADVTLHWERSGHTLTRGEIAAAQEWLAGSGLLDTPQNAQ